MNHIGTPFTELTSIDSTNNYAMAKVHEGMASHGFTVFAHQQTAGKGQRGRQWKTRTHENIMLSVVLKPASLSIAQQFYLSATIALGCFDFFKKFAVDNVFVKWPNDIYWNDRKAGGILIENILIGNKWQYAVAGIGININQTIFADDVVNAVSLKQITGKEFNTIEMAKTLCQFLQKRYKLLHPANLQNILAEYNAVLYKKDKKVRLKKDNAVFETMIKGVNEQGQLLTSDTLEREFSFGEVVWVI